MSLMASMGMRALAALAIVSASLALAACGDDEDSDAGTQSALGSERYEALEAVYRAAVPLDEIDDDASVSEFDPLLERYGKECNKLDADDALLGAYRRFCPLIGDLREQLTAIGACEDQTEVEPCLDGVRGFRGVARTFLREGPRYDGVVKREKLTPSCEKALVNPEIAYEVMRGYGRAFAYLERALTDGTEADAEKADELIKQIEAKADDVPEAKEALADFRSGCD